MGLLVKHILKHPSGRRSYRRKYPPELRPFLPTDELKVSLGLENSPGFLSRYEQAAAQFVQNVAAARRRLEGAFDPLDAPLIAYLAKAFRVEALDSDEEGRWSPAERKLYSGVAADLEARSVSAVVPFEEREGQRWALKHRHSLEVMLPKYREMKANGDMDAIVAMWRDEALDLIEAKGLVVDPAAEGPLALLCRALNDAAISAAQDQLRRLNGEEVPTPAEPATPCVPAPPQPAGSRVPLLATYDAYASAQGMTPGVRDEWRRYIERLIKFLGHDDAAQITAAKLREWRDELLVEKSEKGLVRAPVTVRDKYITSIRALMKWAVQEGKLPANAASEVTVRVPKRAKLRERNFTNEEAEAILAAALKPASPRLSLGYRLARRWIPWLCAYTGARVNEFSQLRGEDVQQIEGIWCVRITPEAGTVKAKQARVVPLHEHLIEQGFVDVVKARGLGPIFYEPSKQRVKTESNRHFKKVGERLADWVRKDIGITDPGLQPNHAWRHTFKSLSYAAGIDERTADAIQGHANKTVGRTYLNPPLKTVAAAINRLPRFNVAVAQHAEEATDPQAGR